MQMQPDTAAAPIHLPPRFLSTLPPPPPSTTERATDCPAPSQAAPPSLMERVVAWGANRHSTIAALLVACASLGAWFGFSRAVVGGIVRVFVQCEPSRWGLPWEGAVALNDSTDVAIVSADPPELVAVASVGDLLRQLEAPAKAAPPARVAVPLPNGPVLLVQPAGLASALEALEEHRAARVALYACDTRAGARLVVLGAGYLVAVAAVPAVGAHDAPALDLQALPLDHLALGLP